MKEPIWITKSDCLAFHSSLLARFGGGDGIRDQGALEASLHRPLQKYHYEQPDLFDLAACYISGIVQSHPFLDGNKRSGLMAGVLFLELNGLRFEATEEEAALQILALADCRLSDPELTVWLSRSCSVRQ